MASRSGQDGLHIWPSQEGIVWCAYTSSDGEERSGARCDEGAISQESQGPIASLTEGRRLLSSPRRCALLLRRVLCEGAVLVASRYLPPPICSGRAGLAGLAEARLERPRFIPISLAASVPRRPPCDLWMYIHAYHERERVRRYAPICVPVSCVRRPCLVARDCDGRMAPAPITSPGAAL